MDVASAIRAVRQEFAGADPELPNGFAEHVPMGVDALLSLGVAPASVVQWAARHEPLPVDPDGPVAVRRRSLLAALEHRPWEDVVRSEVSVLVRHLDAHLFHGLLRTAHAVRTLQSGADDVALAELATALAAWHTWAGPARRSDPDPGSSPLADPVAFVLDAARRGAGGYLERPSIVTLHAVTAPMALLLLVDVLDDEAVAAGARAIVRTHARYPEAPTSNASEPPDAEALAGLAHRWDAHPAKLVEAAMRGFTATGDGVFLDAAEAIMG